MRVPAAEAPLAGLMRIEIGILEAFDETEGREDAKAQSHARLALELAQRVEPGGLRQRLCASIFKDFPALLVWRGDAPSFVLCLYDGSTGHPREAQGA